MAVAVSAVVGYVLLIALTLAIKDMPSVLSARDPAGHNVPAVIAILNGALGARAGGGVSGTGRDSDVVLRSLSRDLEFANDLCVRAGPAGCRVRFVWKRVSARYSTPAPAIWLCVVVAFAATISSGTYAVVTSISVIGLYFSYIIPVYLAWRRRGTAAAAPHGPWHLGRLGSAINLVAILWVIFITGILSIPDNMRAGKTIAGADDPACGVVPAVGAASLPRSRMAGIRQTGLAGETGERGRTVGDLTATERGRLTLDELRGLVDREQIDTVIVGFTDHYGRLLGKRYDAEMFIDETATHGSHGCDYLLTTDMEMEPVPGYRFANWEQGLRRLSSRSGSGNVVGGELARQNGLGAVRCKRPGRALRCRLRRARFFVDRWRRHESLGSTPTAASELEYYLFQQSYRQAADLDYRTIQPAGWYLEDYHILQGTRTEPFTAAVRRHLKASGVPVENIERRMGTRPARNQRPLRRSAADGRPPRRLQAMLEGSRRADGTVGHVHGQVRRRSGRLELSHPFQPVARRQERVRRGCRARWSEVLGSVSLVPRRLDRPRAGRDGVLRSDRQLLQAVRGCIVGADASSPGATTIAPPAFRVVGEGSSLRIECRIPGADCNPYLAFAAALASGLDGIRNRIEPPPCFKGDMYAARDLPHVPDGLDEAADRFAASEFAARTFGDDVVEHYAHFFRTEQAAFDRAVTDWERRRYFERI